MVDDSEICRDLVKLVLQARGYEVVTLDSPFGFGATVAREQPDLVLVDVNMPGLQGGKLVEFAVQKGICSCPIVFHSDRSPRELQSLVLSSGASGYVQKTSDGDELCARVEEFINATWQKRDRDRAPESIRPSATPPAMKTDIPPVSRVPRGLDAPPASQRGVDMSSGSSSVSGTSPAVSPRFADASPVSQRNPDAAPVSQRTVTSSNGWVRGKF